MIKFFHPTVLGIMEGFGIPLPVVPKICSRYKLASSGSLNLVPNGRPQAEVQMQRFVRFPFEPLLRECIRPNVIILEIRPTSL